MQEQRDACLTLGRCFSGNLRTVRTGEFTKRRGIRQSSRCQCFTVKIQEFGDHWLCCYYDAEDSPQGTTTAPGIYI